MCQCGCYREDFEGNCTLRHSPRPCDYESTEDFWDASCDEEEYYREIEADERRETRE